MAARSSFKFAGVSSVVALSLWAVTGHAQSAGGTGGVPGTAGAGGGAQSSAGTSGAQATAGAQSSGGSADVAGGGGGGTATAGASSSAAGASSSAAGASSSAAGASSSAAGASSSAGGAGSGTSPSNLVSNGTFDTTDSSPWWSYSNSTTDHPADETLAVTNGQLCATMTAGGQNYWDVLIGLSDLALLPNQYYHITFSISADANREIRFKTGLGDTPYTDYFNEPVQVTATAQTVDYTYLNLRNDPTAQFQFQIGSTPGTVCVDNIIIEPVAAPVAPTYVTKAPSGHPFKYYEKIVKMGTAVDTPIFLSNPLHNSIVAGEFSMITPANSMKMDLIQPTQGVFDFTDTDALVAWAQTNGLEFHGHPLVWHTEVPSWVTSGMFNAADLTNIMYAHIDTLMARYVGKFPYWDVVNEAFADDGSGFRPTVWHDTIGDNFMDLAFTRAHADDPNAKLLYNDYNIEQKGTAKSDRVFAAVQDMKTRGIPIDAIGFQGHYFVTPEGDTSQGLPDMQAIRDNMARYNDLGIDVQITECDFRVGLPLDDNKTQIQNKFYADLLQVCIDAPNCSHFTVWGLSDLDSWVPGTFAGYDDAHLFDKALAPKPDYFAMSTVFGQQPAPTEAGGSGGAASGSGPGSSSSGKSSGCSFGASPTHTTPWLLGALTVLGILVSRRRSKARERLS